MTDWNHDGRIDNADASLDYAIYKDATKPRTQPKAANRATGCAGAVLWIIGTVTALLLLLAR